MPTGRQTVIFSRNFTDSDDQCSKRDCHYGQRARSSRLLRRRDREWPSIFVAVREQLGLKLEPQVAPVPLIVIDYAEKPTPEG